MIKLLLSKNCLKHIEDAIYNHINKKFGFIKNLKCFIIYLLKDINNKQ